MTEPAVSVVIPVYGCVDCLAVLHDRLTRTLGEQAGSYEIVYVDDRSPDGAWRALLELARSDDHVRLIRLSRNFGQHIAITAGIAESTGRLVVLMDCDLQDRPEDIPLLLALERKGYDIVFSRRGNREQSWFRSASGRLYFRLRNALLGLDMDVEHGSLMLFTRQVADEFLRVRDRDRQHGIILAWLGFESTMVELEHAPRHAGRSSYTFGKLVASAVDGLFFQTTILLRWIVYLGLAVGLIGVLLAIALAAVYSFVVTPPGWTSLAVLLLVLSGFTIISLGVAALYVGKIFEQVKDRPLYIVDRRVRGGGEFERPALTSESSAGG